MLSLSKRYYAVIIFIVFILPLSASAQGIWGAWKYRMPLKLTHRSVRTIPEIPVDATFSLFADQCADPEREIRLILAEGGTEKEIPFQLSHLSRWTRNTDGEKSLPTLNGVITFFDAASGDGTAEYFILYGNPGATKPSYPTDIRISGERPAWTIDNGVMTVRLHTSGQFASVRLKNNPTTPIETTQTGIMHWNPGVYIPTVHWAHAFDWNPPEVCEIEEGPLFVEIRRSGVFPKIPSVHLSITYRIFGGETYIESSTALRVIEDTGVVALRNDELVFDKGFFSHVAWNDGRETTIRRLDSYTPVNRHGDILRLADTTPFITLFDPVRGVGAATIRKRLSDIGPGAEKAVLFDNASYVTNGDMQYWFRPRVYFHVDWDRKQLITVPAGSVYSEENLYYFYKPTSQTDIAGVETLAKAVRTRPNIEMGPYRLPPEK